MMPARAPRAPAIRPRALLFPVLVLLLLTASCSHPSPGARARIHVDRDGGSYRVDGDAALDAFHYADEELSVQVPEGAMLSEVIGTLQAMETPPRKIAWVLTCLAEQTSRVELLELPQRNEPVRGAAVP